LVAGTQDLPSVSRRRPESAERFFDQTGEGDRRAVFEVGADDLGADGKAASSREARPPAVALARSSVSVVAILFLPVIALLSA
jgi:hypothetical protein